MAGIELVRDRETRTSFPVEEKVAIRVIKEARRRGAMLRPLSDVLVLMPPLAISHDELETLLDIVSDSIRAVAETL
jgi:adenosylmethionine-8-amino-7-oxononanoate aminotransferase